MTWGRRRLVWGAAAVVSCAVWAWFASGVRTFTRPAEVLTFVPGLLVLTATVRFGARRRSRTEAAGAVARSAGGPGARRWLPWVGLAIAIGGLELTELFSQPRRDHPTLSSLTDTILGPHPSRFIGYALWLAAGWLLIRDLRDRHE